MRYFMILVLLMLLVAGTVFGQEIIATDEAVISEPVFAIAEVEDPIESTGRDMSSIRRKISEIKEVVQTDYEVLLATNPEVGGTITISFSITPEGTVVDAYVDSPEELSTLREDILSVLAELDFGPASDQTEDIPVTIPFTLNPPQ
ncbi:MAG: AgmX/PglI C-terminal domain-containing protein [Candidatus Sabulitectum sp.]|nr:AgmX/PglI C-terminal domain-containing protein [Candidatus Sabulitectum sp.]